MNKLIEKIKNKCLAYNFNGVNSVELDSYYKLLVVFLIIEMVTFIVADRLNVSWMKAYGIGNNIFEPLIFTFMLLGYISLNRYYYRAIIFTLCSYVMTVVSYMCYGKSYADALVSSGLGLLLILSLAVYLLLRVNFDIFKIRGTGHRDFNIIQMFEKKYSESKKLLPLIKFWIWCVLIIITALMYTDMSYFDSVSYGFLRLTLILEAFTPYYIVCLMFTFSDITKQVVLLNYIIYLVAVFITILYSGNKDLVLYLLNVLQYTIVILALFKNEGDFKDEVI